MTTDFDPGYGPGPVPGSYDPVRVHDVTPRRRYRTVFQTIVLTPAEPAQPILPQSDDRHCAWIQALDNDIVLTGTLGQAQAPGNAAGPSAASINANAQANAPGAGQVITSAFLPAGTYTVAWAVGLGGTTGGPEVNNFQMFLGATPVLISMNGSSSGSIYSQPAVTIVVPAGGATLSIQAIALSTPASIYRAQFAAVPLGPAGSGPFPSGTLIPKANTAPYPVQESGVVYAGATNAAVNSRVAVTAVYLTGDG